MTAAGQTEYALETRDLRVDYGDFTAVRDISLKIPKGEIYGLVGPNGAGKTSTIKVVATLMEPTYGDVFIEGLDIEEKRQAVHRLLGYMPDLAPTTPEMRVWEFLDMFAGAYGLAPGPGRKRWEECLELVQLTESRDVLCGSLSRGMTQRLILAKTLIPHPSVLLLDEPASGMDPMARISLRNILQELVREQQVTVLISSHILTELADMCTSVGIMSKGSLLFSGDIDEVAESVAKPHREVELTWITDAVPADLDVPGLLQRDQVMDLSMQSGGASFQFYGEDGNLNTFLRELVEAGLPLVRFAPKKAGIEDVLLDIEQKEKANG